MTAFNWDNLGVWLNEGDEPDARKAKQYGIKTFWRAGAVASQFVAGSPVYFGANWYPEMSPQQYAAHVSEFIAETNPAAVMLDLENVSQAYIAAVLVGYRKLRPTRPTAITTEPWKGDGNILPLTVMTAAKVRWFVQLYDGAMNPVNPAGVMLNAARAYPPGWVYPFYGGNSYPGDARNGGCIFTQSLLA